MVSSEEHTIEKHNLEDAVKFVRPPVVLGGPDWAKFPDDFFERAYALKQKIAEPDSKRAFALFKQIRANSDLEILAYAGALQAESNLRNEKGEIHPDRQRIQELERTRDLFKGKAAHAQSENAPFFEQLRDEGESVFAVAYQGIERDFDGIVELVCPTAKRKHNSDRVFFDDAVFDLIQRPL